MLIICFKKSYKHKTSELSFKLYIISLVPCSSLIKEALPYFLDTNDNIESFERKFLEQPVIIKITIKIINKFFLFIIGALNGDNITSDFIISFILFFSLNLSLFLPLLIGHLLEKRYYKYGIQIQATIIEKKEIDNIQRVRVGSHHLYYNIDTVSLYLKYTYNNEIYYSISYN